MKECDSSSKAGEDGVMVGRQHDEDENGTTTYLYARIAG